MGSAEDEKYEQVLPSVMVGAVNIVGNYKVHIPGYTSDSTPLLINQCPVSRCTVPHVVF